MTLPLSYAKLGERRAPIVLQRLSLLCATAPALIGVACLLGYWISDAEIFALGGFFTLLGGGATLMLGLVMSLVYLALAWRATVDRAKSLRRAMVVLIILLLDIPLAGFCSWAGTSLMDRPKLAFVLRNVGTTNISGGLFHLGDEADDFGPMKPGESQKVKLRINGAGAVAVDVNYENRRASYIVFRSADADVFRGRSETIIEIFDDKVAH